MDNNTKEKMGRAVQEARLKLEQAKDKHQLTQAIQQAQARSNERPFQSIRQTEPLLEQLKSAPEVCFRTLPQFFSKKAENLEWTCLKCGETPPIQPLKNGFRRERCRCERLAEEKAEAARFEDYKKQARLEHVAKENVTYTWLGHDYSSLGGKTLSDFEKQYQPQAYGLMVAYINQLKKRNKPYPNVLLWGLPGRGKTHLAAALLNVLGEAGFSVLFAPVRQYLNVLNAADFDEKENIRRRMGKADVVVFDDVDKAPSTEGTKNEIWEVVDLRYVANRPTIMTANTDDLAKLCNEPTVSRMKENLRLIPVAGSSRDYREILAERNWNIQKQAKAQ